MMHVMVMMIVVVMMMIVVVMVHGSRLRSGRLSGLLRHSIAGEAER
jgi:hypothetical protein